MVRLRKLGSTGLEVSEIGFGALEIGRDWAADVNEDSTHCSESEAATLLNQLLDAGVNLIDTAPAYWKSEAYIGRAIAHRRSEYVLASKVGEQWSPEGSIYDYSYAATLQFIDSSLSALQTDHIDLIQIHSASLDVINRGETFEAMAEARRAGKVLHIGMTGGVAECIRAIEVGGYETVQVPYNLLNTAAEDRLLPLAAERGVGVIIMRGLAGGKLTRKFEKLENIQLREAIRGFLHYCPEATVDDVLAATALKYVLSRPEVSSVIVGSRRIEAVSANLACIVGALPEATIASIREYARGLQVQTW